MTAGAPIRDHVERSRPPREYSAEALTVLLQRGLHWLYDIAQPPGAIIDGRHAVATSENRLIRFVPLGWGWHAGIVVDVAHVHWGAGPGGAALNPMPRKRDSCTGGSAGRARRRCRRNTLPVTGSDRHD